MSTGRSIVSTCPARAAVAGNPSDGYGGAVVAVPVRDLAAFASIEPGDHFSVRATDPDLARLLRATAAAFTDAVAPVSAGTLSATTTIPRSVGLAGSSALIIAALRVLAETAGHRYEPVELAELALSVERDRMGIEAGLQDRLVQAVGDPVSMRFDPVDYAVLSSPVQLPLFVAWSVAASESSDTMHRSLRRRFDAGTPHVLASMRGLAEQAECAAEAIVHGDLPGLARAIARTFEIRAMLVDVDPATTHLVKIADDARAAANSAGSGGSIIGVGRTADHVEQLGLAYRAEGFGFLDLS